MKPEELLFSKTHEWVGVTSEGGQKIATVGISAFALQQLTDLVYLALPEVNRRIRAGESLGEVESVKAVSDVYSPVSGEIVEVNRQLPDVLEKLSDDPYGAGWIAKIRISDELELDELMDHAAYQRQCAEEG